MYACDNGTVESITEDELMGISITISHTDGFTSVYSNLSTGKMAQVGQAVTKGQIISGVGFLGAGTIIVTGRNRVKGLTTAAGLWADACLGLAIGVGFYSAAIMGCTLILLVMSVLHRLDDKMIANAKNMDLYMEFHKMSDLGAFMTKIKEFGMKISEIEMTKSNSAEDVGVAVLLTIKLEKKRPHTEIIQLLSQVEGVCYLEEI